MADYRYQYAYAVDLGFNLPSGGHWSKRRHQYVAAASGGHPPRRRDLPARPEDSLHRGLCVAGPIRDIRWVVKWLDPRLQPRIVLGSKAWLERRF